MQGITVLDGRYGPLKHGPLPCVPEREFTVGIPLARFDPLYTPQYFSKWCSPVDCAATHKQRSWRPCLCHGRPAPAV